MYVDVTAPDGSKDTLGPFRSDPVGTSYTNYIPTQAGTYTFVFRFEGDTLTGDPEPQAAGSGLEETSGSATPIYPALAIL